MCALSSLQWRILKEKVTPSLNEKSHPQPIFSISYTYSQLTKFKWKSSMCESRIPPHNALKCPLSRGCFEPAAPRPPFSLTWTMERCWDVEVPLAQSQLSGAKRRGVMHQGAAEL